jgi:HD-like signal output (HDOD) protein
MQEAKAYIEQRLQIQQLHELPPLPFAAARILQILSSSYDSADIHELADLIKLCPGLSARIVGLANTAYFQGNRKVYTVLDAVIRIGLSMVKGLTLGILLANPLKPYKVTLVHLKQYWYEAILTATCASQLAGFMGTEGRPLKEEAYLAGLLHNLGLLILAHVFPEEMAVVFADELRDSHVTLVNKQRTLLCVDQHQAASWVLHHWRLPERLIAVVEHYHEPGYRGEHWQLSLLIGFCSRWIVHRFEALDLLDQQADSVSALAIARADLGRLASACREHADKLLELADLLGKDTSTE